MELTFASMFAGIEAPRVALEPLGWKCVWENEIDKNCCKLLRKHYGDKELVEGDIRNVDTKSIPNHTLLVAGFPCQPFSVAGQRKGIGEDRGTLFTHIARVATIKRPKFLLLENVKGLLSSSNGRDFAIILRVLGSLGYLLEWQVLNSKYFGIPQDRERVFVIGHLAGASGRKIFPIKLESFNAESVEEWKGATSSTLSTKCVERWNCPAVEVKQKTSNGDTIRYLTPIECERLQGFPDDYTNGFSRETRYKMLGNSMTTSVIRFLGEQIMLSSSVGVK